MQKAPPVSGGPGNRTTGETGKRFLVIRHGALGDFFQAFPVFDSLRQAFPGTHITLLTGSFYQNLATRSPWFDAVVTDDRPSFADWRHLVKMHRLFSTVDRVYDFQNSSRTRHYQRLSRLSRKRPDWCSAHPGARWRHATPLRRQMHTLLRQEEQLRCAGIPSRPRHVPHWLQPEVVDKALGRLAAPYVVLVPGAAAHRPAKRWPVEHYAALLPLLQKHGLEAIVVGSTGERKAGHSLAQAAAELGLPLHDLTGHTSLTGLAEVMRGATLVIGNDTGPLHVAAAMDAPTLTLFSAESDPRRTAPLSVTPGRSHILSMPDLNALQPETVIAYLEGHLLTEPSR
ncbi:lipopolysaccharide heptosyltransferase family protein [Oecophyllibacter saccharovorans]|uniref:glycosyltransferase family 9 protein n=1 Tax=Oecophyllibacter saccharovorans TaxID=2558360 RepID=UPI0011438AA2|nr:glycosyltransferase family 9 protein [Oecophyllibacter saccharovorans]QDH15357.1 lipopolysaccharide heptosyltransferase family protein [Oecophyllibacter saccharovorans]